MKRITNALVLALGLLASTPLFAQTAVVQALQNVTNRAGTYHAAVTGLVVNSSATDAIVLIGSATKTVYVKSLKVSCTLTTAAQAIVQLYKRSNADTVVSATALSSVALDSSDGAATAVVNTYVSGTAANPTLGSGVLIDTETMTFLAPATATGGKTTFSREWGVGMDRYVVLRGVAQSLAVNFNGATLTGSLCNVSVAWMER